MLPLCISGQIDSTFTAWIEVQTIDEKQVVSAWCQNNTVAPEHLRYMATLYLHGSEDRRESSTLTLPHQPTLLLKAVFVVPSRQYDSITVKVFKQNQLVAAKLLTGKPSVSQPLPPERIGTLPSDEAEFLPFNEFEIEGLILDETRSKMAHDFYELFYNSWVPPENILESYLIVIRELPTRTGLGARVSVEVNDQEMTQLDLQPRTWEELALQLIDALKNYLVNPDGTYQEINLEDLDGTGIY